MSALRYEETTYLFAWDRWPWFGISEYQGSTRWWSHICRHHAVHRIDYFLVGAPFQKVKCTTISGIMIRRREDIYNPIPLGCKAAWTPVGETPVVSVTGRCFSFNMISAVSPRGDCHSANITNTGTEGCGVDPTAASLGGAVGPLMEHCEVKPPACEEGK